MSAPHKPRFSVREAIAAHLEEDVGEVERTRRYQPTRCPCPVYTVGNDYLTATSSPKKNPKGDDQYVWRRVPQHGYVKLAGWQIWLAK